MLLTSAKGGAERPHCNWHNLFTSKVCCRKALLLSAEGSVSQHEAMHYRQLGFERADRGRLSNDEGRRFESCLAREGL
jgi:hypothetical protein